VCTSVVGAPQDGDAELVRRAQRGDVGVYETIAAGVRMSRPTR
jgi:hypothetical protein